ncbi:MAG: carboxypeptidase-like regulatory domain-containing protein, partial [Bacteroidota bacterium]
MIRFSVVFLTILVTCVNTLAQNCEVTGRYVNQPFSSVIEEIESQCELKFFYEEDWIDSLTVNGNYVNTPLNRVLDDLLVDSKINWIEYDKRIILTNNNPIITGLPVNFLDRSRTSQDDQVAFVFKREYQEQNAEVQRSLVEIGNKKNFSIGQSSSIRGRITDQNGASVVGALVYITEPAVSATSGENGIYSIELPNGAHDLRFQFTGMEAITQPIILFSDGSLNVTMSPDIIALEEIVIRSDRDINIKDVTMGVNRIDLETANLTPQVLGEADILRVATTLPG